MADFAGRPDFPKCALGEHLDIGGYTGVLVQIVNQSIKVKSPDGNVQSFNAGALRKLYGPRVHPDPIPSSPPPSRLPELAQPAQVVPDAPKRMVIDEPNFDQDMKAVRLFASRSDFPECALGELVDIRGYSGVVVEIAKGSLIVRAQDGLSRSYNVEVLRKLYGQK